MCSRHRLRPTRDYDACYSQTGGSFDGHTMPGFRKPETGGVSGFKFDVVVIYLPCFDSR